MTVAFRLYRVGRVKERQRRELAGGGREAVS